MDADGLPNAAARTACGSHLCWVRAQIALAHRAATLAEEFGDGHERAFPTAGQGEATLASPAPACRVNTPTGRASR